jgi:hypothetical protein
MFGRRYFAGRYFAPRYFPDGGSGGVTTPADLYEAVADLLAADGTLATLFGRDDWFWIDTGPVDDSLPYAVLTHTGDDVEGLPISGSGLPHVVNRTFEIRVYDEDRGDARAAGEAIATAVEAGVSSLTNDEASVLDCTRTGDQGDELDPDPGTGGQDVWSYRVEFIAMLNRT